MKFSCLWTPAFAALLCGCVGHSVTASYDVVPMPASVAVDTVQTPFELTEATVITFPAGDSVLARQADMLAGFIDAQAGIKPAVRAAYEGDGAIRLDCGSAIGNAEAYKLTVAPSVVEITGASPAGTFYGIQTLRKSIPTGDAGKVLLPCVVITDMPRFAYRGAHLDVARHFFPADSLKVFIDMLALHNINKFHLHLTDHQGWRMEVKSRPRLTETGSRRPRTIVGKTTGTFDDVPVEGFYTQEQLRDLVAYAAARNITIIPEVDVPGHTLSALASYPGLGCTGGPYEVYCKWDLAPTDALCVGNPETYRFLDDVFGELCDIFPSDLIHIGGDECPKERWMECGRCQALADSLGFVSDAHGTREAKLQNHLMHHVADYLKSRGRRVIGWDEVLDSDFDADAVVMSWRGEQGGIDGAAQGHDVVMTPNTYLYFDYYQSTDIAAEPLAIGSYVPVEKVYSYEPVPDVLTPEQQKRIIGVQANLWTEYVPTFSHVQYMELPRMAALAEVQWCGAGSKDFGGFVKRLMPLLGTYGRLGYDYARHVLDVKGNVSSDPLTRTVKAELSTYDGAPVRYTLDGSEPTLSSALYSAPLVFDGPVRLCAAAERDGALGRVYRAGIQMSKSTFKTVTLSVPPHPRYTFEGASALVDGRLGTFGYTDGLWLGFNMPSTDIMVDLEHPQSVSKVTLGINVNTDSWIFEPRRVVVEGSSDGKDFATLSLLELAPLEQTCAYLRTVEMDFEPVELRYVRVHVESESSIPAWHPGNGKPAFVFIDELGIY